MSMNVSIKASSRVPFSPYIAPNIWFQRQGAAAHDFLEFLKLTISLYRKWPVEKGRKIPLIINLSCRHIFIEYKRE
jgi:hypothetical protein